MHIYNLSQHQFYKRGRTVYKAKRCNFKASGRCRRSFCFMEEFFFVGLNEMRSYVGWNGNEALVASFIVFSRVRTERLMKQSGNNLHSELCLHCEES